MAWPEAGCGSGAGQGVLGTAGQSGGHSVDVLGDADVGGDAGAVEREFGLLQGVLPEPASGTGTGYSPVKQAMHSADAAGPSRRPSPSSEM